MIKVNNKYTFSNLSPIKDKARLSKFTVNNKNGMYSLLHCPPILLIAIRANITNKAIFAPTYARLFKNPFFIYRKYMIA